MIDAIKQANLLGQIQRINWASLQPVAKLSAFFNQAPKALRLSILLAAVVSSSSAATATVLLLAPDAEDIQRQELLSKQYSSLTKFKADQAQKLIP